MFVKIFKTVYHSSTCSLAHDLLILASLKNYLLLFKQFHYLKNLEQNSPRLCLTEKIIAK